MRLNDTQFITAIAEMSDGSFWSGKAEVIVTMPACVEE
jgi:sulfur-oxidizing protein SoxY